MIAKSNTRKSPAWRGRRTSDVGFTLIELLVVIAIISLLVSILLPSLTRATALAETVVCVSQMRSLALKIQFYTGDNEDYFPQAEQSGTFGGYTGPGLPWHTVALGGVDAWPTNSQLVQCPSVDRTTYTWRSIDICYNVWLGYDNHPTWRAAYGWVQTDDVISPSKTGLLGDASGAKDFAYYYPNGPYRIFEWGAWPHYLHVDRCNFLFIDGHSEPMTQAVAEPLWFNGNILHPLARPF